LFEIFILFLAVSMALKANNRVPLFVPLFSWFSGHNGTLADTEGHKKPASLLSVCDFVRKIESVQIVCEASALPLSQAGGKSFKLNSYSQVWTSHPL
jgi:hypothetical protein